MSKWNYNMYLARLTFSHPLMVAMGSRGRREFERCYGRESVQGWVLPRNGARERPGWPHGGRTASSSCRAAIGMARTLLFTRRLQKAFRARSFHFCSGQPVYIIYTGYTPRGSF